MWIFYSTTFVEIDTRAVDAVWSHLGTGWGAASCWSSASVLSGNCSWQKTATSPRVLTLFLGRACTQMTGWCGGIKVVSSYPNVGWLCRTNSSLCGRQRPSSTAQSSFILSPHSCYSWEHAQINFRHANFHLRVCFLGKLICSYWSQKLSE